MSPFEALALCTICRSGFFIVCPYPIGRMRIARGAAIKLRVATVLLLTGGFCPAQMYTISTVAGGWPLQTPVPAVGAPVSPSGLGRDPGELPDSEDRCGRHCDDGGRLGSQGQRGRRRPRGERTTGCAEQYRGRRAGESLHRGR